MHHQLVVQLKSAEILSRRWGERTATLLLSTLFLCRLPRSLTGEKRDPVWVKQRERGRKCALSHDSVAIVLF